MYRLVDPPASDHNRKPGRAVPVGGVSPSSAAQAEADDVDAALLLGMRRYAAATSPAARYGLVGAAAAIFAFLALAVWMALRMHSLGDRTCRALWLRNVVVPAESTGSKITPLPESHPSEKKAEPPVEPPKKNKLPTDPASTKNPPVEPKKGPLPPVGEPVLAPLAGREVIGALDTSNPMIDALAIVVTRGPEPGLPWERLDGKSPKVPRNRSRHGSPRIQG